MRGSPPRHPDDPKAEFSALEGIIQDASELKPGDRLVYPSQGVCAVIGVEVKEIAGQRLELVRMRREEDGAAVMIPKGKVPLVGLRRVASGELMEGVFHYLAADHDDPELDWKVRHRDNADRLVGGGVLGVAEVVKGLHALSLLRPLPAKEREQYDNSRHLLVSEVAVSLHVPPGVAEDFIDFVLIKPAGVVFKLKPPPKPILMPNRPKRKRFVVDDEGDGLEGLGLDDLGIDGLGAVGGETPAAEGESAEGGEESEGAEGEGEGGETAAAPVPAPAPATAPKKAARPEPVPATSRVAKVPPAARPAPAMKPAPAAKPGPVGKPAPAPKPAPAAKAAPEKAAKATKPVKAAASPPPAPKKAPAKVAPAKKPKAPAKKAAPAPKKPAPKTPAKGGGKKK
ncbi:MAG: CarD family transcriptional regulator [Anaeromyxobacter sp.]|nr:CarD family transcriptional regulator [Anaeromyxobacter sp.]MBL0278490.1 CarD family transcriptional regulator [Anaeromyxobacter sp.]